MIICTNVANLIITIIVIKISNNDKYVLEYAQKKMISVTYYFRHNLKIISINVSAEITVLGWCIESIHNTLSV